MNGIPEQVTPYWHRAKQAAKELESVNREARIIPCMEVPEGWEEDTKPNGLNWTPPWIADE